MPLRYSRYRLDIHAFYLMDSSVSSFHIIQALYIRARLSYRKVKSHGDRFKKDLVASLERHCHWLGLIFVTCERTKRHQMLSITSLVQYIASARLETLVTCLWIFHMAFFNCCLCMYDVSFQMVFERMQLDNGNSVSLYGKLVILCVTYTY